MRAGVCRTPSEILQAQVTLNDVIRRTVEDFLTDRLDSLSMTVRITFEELGASLMGSALSNDDGDARKKTEEGEKVFRDPGMCARIKAAYNAKGWNVTYDATSFTFHAT